MDEKYDYIISGAGCAGLSLLMRMIGSQKFLDKKVLLIDQTEKKANDRTWCFWEKGHGFFEQLVYQRWQKLWFHSKDYSSLKSIAPYTYKMIRGIDFYNHCFGQIRGHSQVDMLFGKVEKLESNEQETYLIVDGKKINGSYIFNSIALNKPQLTKKEFHLLQHFKGWVIEAKDPIFETTEATLMDFRIGQEEGMGFVYILPFTNKKALVEYTLFSDGLLQDEAYNEGLKNYLQKFYPSQPYTLLEEEFGIIPMTNYRFAQRQHHIFNIGIQGGMTKGSSGYTFQFIQKQSDQIIQSLIEKGEPVLKPSKKRFHFYDSVLLNVMATGKLRGDRVFTDLFSKNKIANIFAFLDNESHFFQEMNIIRSLPTKPFLNAAREQIF